MTGGAGEKRLIGFTEHITPSTGNIVISVFKSNQIRESIPGTPELIQKTHLMYVLCAGTHVVLAVLQVATRKHKEMCLWVVRKRSQPAGVIRGLHVGV